jgi:integrase
VKAATAKKGKRRVVMISNNLHAWLAPLQASSGPVRPPNYRKSVEKAQTLAGITSWPNNALRHSFASYHLAHYRNGGDTSIQLGHRGSLQMLHEHYNAVAKPADASAFWQIFPRNRTESLTLVAA